MQQTPLVPFQLVTVINVEMTLTCIDISCLQISGGIGHTH